MKPKLTARLAYGCRVGFQEAKPGSPVTVVIERKSETCTLALHVGGMALYDHRSAIRPSTRLSPPLQPDYEDG